MILKRLNIEIDKGIYGTIVAKQEDTASRYLFFKITHEGLPFDLTDKSVKFYAEKPDGNIIFNNANIVNEVNGECEVELTTQTLAVAGRLYAELVIFSKDMTKKLSTIPFLIEVVKSIFDNKAIESSNEFSALTEALKKFEEVILRIEEVEIKIESKWEVFSAEILPEIANRKQKTVYCKITDKVTLGGPTTIRVSPNMGIKI